VINRTGDHWNENGDLVGQLLIGIASQPNLGWAELCAQESLLKIERAQLLRKKKVNGHARKRLAHYVGELLLHDVGRRNSGIAEFHAGNEKRGTLNMKFLDIAFGQGVGKQLVLNRYV